ncbi:hypothetical protein COO60DRAFT_1485160, partial [Scenedesmus sp. NREL 46B-D3]
MRGAGASTALLPHCQSTVGPSSQPPPEPEAAPQLGTAAAMMLTMGWEAGKGLGRDQQGMAEPLAVADNARRAGLGFAAPASSSAAQPVADPYQPKPDAVPFLNSGVQQSTQHKGGSGSAEAYCSAGALFTPQQALALLHPKLLLLPGTLMRSKFLPDDQLLLQLREARKKAATAADAAVTSSQTAAEAWPTFHHACLHLGDHRVAPLASSSSSRGLWHMEALDVLLQL